MMSDAVTRRRRLLVVLGLLCNLLLSATSQAADDKSYELHYRVELLPAEKSALVSITIPDARLLRAIDFNLNEQMHSHVEANGELALGDGRAVWNPPEKAARFSLRVRIPHERSPGEYDAYINQDWAIFRGDDLVPPASVRSVEGAQSRATLEFKLPGDWPSVNTGWPLKRNQHFRIDDPDRRFDRPTGWMIAGKTGTRRDRIGQTRVAVSAPRGSGLHRMDVLSFLNFVWPELEKVFASTPPKLLIVGAGDPMWRGGLSGPNSLFLHSDRPLVSENGTSALIHELVHMVGSIQGQEGHDWIAEGIAEFYAIELLYRSGGMSDARREKVYRDLTEWSSEVDTLIARHSTGARTARATLLFRALDRELRDRSEGRHALDQILPGLMDRKTSLDELRKRVEALLGGESEVLQSALLTSV